MIKEAVACPFSPITADSFPVGIKHQASPTKTTAILERCFFHGTLKRTGNAPPWYVIPCLILRFCVRCQPPGHGFVCPGDIAAPYATPGIFYKMPPARPYLIVTAQRRQGWYKVLRPLFKMRLRAF